MGFIHRGFAVVAALLLFTGLGPRNAIAQVGSPSLTLGAVTHSLPRQGFQTANDLDQNDCSEDDVLSFQLTTQNTGADRLEIWAGTDCGEIANRTPPSSLCWLLYNQTPPSASLVVSLHARDILAGYTNALDGAPAGTLITGTGADECNAPSSAPTTTLLSLAFLLVPADGSVAIAPRWSGTFRSAPPQSPDELTLVPGPEQLVARFDYSNAADSTGANAFELFCDPPPGIASAAGGSSDEGPLGCSAVTPSSTLVPGTVPQALSANRCGDAPGDATKAQILGLTDGVTYQVAVAAVDAFDNVGPLSQIACGTPAKAPADSNPPSDESVRSCSFSPTRRHSPLAWLAFGAALVTATWRRRRR